VDAPVLGAIITSSVAFAVAVGSGIRAEHSTAVERRYERRRAFLMEAQDAALALRDALRMYGTELDRQAAGTDGDDEDGSFALRVADWVDDQVARARGRLEVAQSRVDDPQTREALQAWLDLARRSLIGQEEDAAAEQRAFDEVNRLIGVGLRSSRGLTRRPGRSQRSGRGG
jgi:hypothetical protein